MEAGMNLTRRHLVNSACGASAALASLSTGTLRVFSQQEGRTLEEKSASRERINQTVATSRELSEPFDFIIDDLLAADYGATQVGVFRNVASFHLRWVKPDWFEYLPDGQSPMAFVRHT